MSTFLYKIFLKEQNPKSESGREKYGSFSGIVGIFCNVLLCTLKLSIGFVSGSIAIVADGANNLSDAASSVITLFGFKLSVKPADKKHPFGHARYEYLAALLVAVFILIVGAEIVKSSVLKIITPNRVEFSRLSIYILLFSIILKLWMMVFYKKTGKIIDSLTLFAASQDSRNDVITTVAVLLSAIISPLINFGLDGIMGLLVSLFIIYSGIRLLIVTIDPLLGGAPPENLVSDIRQLLFVGEGVLGIHDLLVHDYGPTRRFATVHIEMAAEGDALKNHDIIDALERKTFEKLGISLVIHYDPIVTECEEVNTMRQMLCKVIAEIDPCISVHDFRMVAGPYHTNLIFDVVVPFGYKQTHLQLIEQINNNIKLQNENYYCVITVDYC